MKCFYLITILFWLSFSHSQSQSINYSHIDHHELIEKFKTKSENLEIIFLHPKKTDQININKRFIVKKFEREICSEQKFNFNENNKIIRVFNEFNLLEDFLLGISKTDFVYHFKTKKEKRYSPNRAKLLIELIYSNNEGKKEDYFLSIEDSKTTWKLLNKLKKVTGMKKCFRDFKKSIFQ